MANFPHRSLKEAFSNNNMRLCPVGELLRKVRSSTPLAPLQKKVCGDTHFWTRARRDVTQSADTLSQPSAFASKPTQFVSLCKHVDSQEKKH